MFGLLAFAPAAHASTPPILKISDNSGNIATIDSTGTAVFSGTCTPSTCLTNFVANLNGEIVWAGNLGTFSVTLSVGLTKPLALPSPSQDLNLQHVTTTADGTITFQWTDVDFNTWV